MRVAVATNKGGLGDSVSPVFGRCPTYTVVEADDAVKGADTVGNPGHTAAGGAGIQAAQYVTELGVNAALAGNFGPNAAAVLERSGVEMVRAEGNVKDAVEAYLRGELKPLEEPNVRGHFGMGRGGRGGGGRGGRGGGGRGRGGGRGGRL